MLQRRHHEDHVAPGNHRALRRAGGAGGVGEDHQVLRRRRRDLLVPHIGIRIAVFPPQPKQVVERHAHGVVQRPEPLHVEDDNLLQ